MIVNVVRGGPGPRQHPPVPVRLLAGHPRRRPRRLPHARPGAAYRPGDGRADHATPSTWPTQYRTPVMILADGLLGQMMEPVSFPEPAERRRPTCSGPGPAAEGLGVDRGDRPSAALHPVADPGAGRARAAQLSSGREVRRHRSEGDTGRARGLRRRRASWSRPTAPRRACAKGRLKVRAPRASRVGLFRPITLWPFPSQPAGRLAKP